MTLISARFHGWVRVLFTYLESTRRLAMVSSIVNRFVFPRPDPPHYSASSHAEHLVWIPASSATPAIPCLYFRSSPPSRNRPLVVWSHANGCDIGTMAGPLADLSRRLNINILAYEYPGYGLCTDEAPSERSVDQHTRQVYQFVREHLKYSPKRIVFYGHSIGTGTACMMVSELGINDRSSLSSQVSSLIRSGTPVGGLILQSPYTSLTELVRGKLGFFGRLIPRLGWNNLKAIQTITCPVLLIHGKQDDLISYQNSIALYDACPSLRKHLSLLDNADHNSIDGHTVLQHLQPFLQTYLP